ncbi:MAG: ABC transporter permease [Proteobacteria bacterium]|nr:ABC transporter permease [Pseudomonadota bacterium]
MFIPLSYSIKNLLTRKITTVLTASGMALVVFVFTTILMMAHGLEKTLIDTGSYDNGMVIRKGSGAELMSWVSRSQASIVESDPQVAIGIDGKPLFAKELNILITLPKKGDNKQSNVTIRGIGNASLKLRPQVKLIDGRMPKQGSSEVAAGRSVVKRFKGVDIGMTLRFGMRDWNIVGIFDAGNTGYNSEIWGDNDQLMQAFRRPVYSSLLFKLKESSEFGKLKERIEKDPRMNHEVKRETKYYADQSEMMAKFLRILGMSLTIIFSLGAVIGAMITMYASVASRVAEIGTMRALGFQRRSIMGAFLLESLLLSLAGGIAGLFFASFLQFFTISTMNFQTFSELAFSFSLNINIAFKSLIFSLIMGFVGGVLPALRASRMNIVDALRQA